MCGIAGVFSYHKTAPPVESESLTRVRERMASRGPDGAGLWISYDKRIGLAHRRLAIIDLSEDGTQPMLDSETGNRVVFNGEIYNFQQLRAQLVERGICFQSHSDTEVLLKLYAVYGHEMLPMLRGMFAFAIWDSRREGIFLARDPFGIKPLYLADDGKTLRFASQVKALLAGGGIDSSIEPAGHVGFFLWGHIPEPYTLYKGIRALPAGTSLWVDSHGRRTRNVFFRLKEEIAMVSTREAVLPDGTAQEQLHESLLDSVRHHLIADVPVGVFLSAGLDSATIAALAKESGVTDLNTLTLGFKEFVGTENDEVPLAERIAERYDTKHFTQWVNKNDFSSQLTYLLDAMDQPSIDGVNSYFVCKAAHDSGLKVVLSGLGGDELFAGYSGFNDIPRMVRIFGPWAKIPAFGAAFRYVTAPLLKRLASPKLAGLFEYGGNFAGAYFLRRGLYMPWELPEVLDRDLIREGWGELNILSTLSKDVDTIGNSQLKISVLEMAWYMRNQLLRDVDWASMAHSLEVRVPLVDKELFRTVMWLAQNDHPMKKEDMASSPSRKLPDSVLRRPKTGFSVPVREWVLSGSDSVDGRGLKDWARYLYAYFKQNRSSIVL